MVSATGKVDRTRFEFWLSRVDISSARGCWIWQGATAGGNQIAHDLGGTYGQMRVGHWREGKRAYVHRWVYEYVYGVAPSGWDVDHVCEVRLCCNPLHLRAMTHTDNAKRPWEPGGASRERVAQLRDSPPDWPDTYTDEPVL